jgi:hypothetical protein
MDAVGAIQGILTHPGCSILVSCPDGAAAVFVPHQKTVEIETLATRTASAVRTTIRFTVLSLLME